MELKEVKTNNTFTLNKLRTFGIPFADPIRRPVETVETLTNVNKMTKELVR